jgi:hypothetical protein
MQEFSKKSYWLALALFFCGCLSVQAQSSIDSIQHNGEQYFVYPFPKEVKIHSDYWKIVDDDAFLRITTITSIVLVVISNLVVKHLNLPLVTFGKNCKKNFESVGN